MVEAVTLYHISTGQVIRNEIKNQTPAGRQVEAYIAKGEFAPDELVIDIVKDYLAHHTEGAGNIFDGFPRNTFQAEQFDQMMAQTGSQVDIMLSLQVPDQEIVDRLLLRGQVSGRADDANEEVIRNRIRIYKEQTEPVEQYYAEQGKFVAIDGVGTIDEIFARLAEAIDNL